MPSAFRYSSQKVDLLNSTFLALTVCVGLAGACNKTHAASVNFQLQDATFDERINVTFGPYFGTDSGIAETITDSNSFTVDPATTSWIARASTNEKGPAILTSLDIGIDIIDVGLGSGEGQVNAEIKYQLVVYNKAGTATQQTVPVHFKGFYSLTQNYTGEVEIANSGVALSAFPTAGGAGTVLVSELLSTINPGPPVSSAFEEILPVTVGSAPLDSVEYTVRMFASVRSRVHAWQNYDMEVGEGSANLIAFIDPEIFIDPTWEHAADFGLAFSANIEPFGAPIPLPATVWLLGSAIGLSGLARRRYNFGKV